MEVTQTQNDLLWDAAEILRDSTDPTAKRVADALEDLLADIQVVEEDDDDEDDEGD